MNQDRFERLIQAYTHECGEHQDWIDCNSALGLLRREHMALVRAVKRLPGTYGQVSLATNDWISRKDVLALLERRGEG